MEVETLGTMLSLSTVVVAAPDQIGCDLGGEEVILDLDSGVYYGLNEVGASIWKLVQEPRSVAEIRDGILEQYDVPSDRCEHDVFHLLNELAERNLISVVEKSN